MAGAESHGGVFEERSVLCCVAFYGGTVVFDVPERLEWRYDHLCAVLDLGNFSGYVALNCAVLGMYYDSSCFIPLAKTIDRGSIPFYRKWL